MRQDLSLSNIRIGYVLSFLNELYFPISVWLFFYLRYLDFKQIAVITVVQVIAQNIFEVPTGAFADVVGRKTAIMLSFILYGLVMLATGFTTVFWIFILLELVRGLSASLYSGSLEALVYDTLKETGDDGRYDRIVANNETFAWVGLFLAAIGGGYLYFINFRAPYVIQAAIYAVAAVLALFLHEPRIDSVKYSVGNFLKQNMAGFGELFRTARMAQVTIVFVVLGAGYFFASNLLGISQAKEYGMDPRGVGFLFGTGYIISALASQAFPRLKSRFGAKMLVIAASAMLLGSFLFARYATIALGAFLIIARISSSTTFRNARSSVMNRMVESKNRATAISTVVLLSQLPYALFAYTAGSYIDAHSPNAFAWILGILLLFLLGAQQLYFSVRRVRTAA